MKINITVRELFTGHRTGGLAPAEWLALNEEGQLKQRLYFVASRAEAIGQIVYDENCGLPANVIGEAQQLHQRATRALQAADNQDFLTASKVALEVERMLADLNAQMAAYAGLKVRAESQKPRSNGGKSTGEIKREQQQANIEDTRRRWEKLAKDGRPERERAGIIANQTGNRVDTVRRWIKEAGLR